MNTERRGTINASQGPAGMYVSDLPPDADTFRVVSTGHLYKALLQYANRTQPWTYVHASRLGSKSVVAIPASTLVVVDTWKPVVPPEEFNVVQRLRAAATSKTLDSTGTPMLQFTEMAIVDVVKTLIDEVRNGPVQRSSS